VCVCVCEGWCVECERREGEFWRTCAREEGWSMGWSSKAPCYSTRNARHCRIWGHEGGETHSRLNRQPRRYV